MRQIRALGASHHMVLLRQSQAGLETRSIPAQEIVKSLSRS